MPHLSVDAMQCAAQISVALQTIVAREVDPLEPAVVTIGKMENDEGSLTCGCGHTFNVICGKVGSCTAPFAHSHACMCSTSKCSSETYPAKLRWPTHHRLSLPTGAPHTGCVIHGGWIHLGQVVMHGTSRSFSDEVQAQVRASIERVAINIAKALGARATVDFDDV